MPLRLVFLHSLVTLTRWVLLKTLGYDLFSNFQFAEWLVCLYCDLEQTSWHRGWDGTHKSTGALVEIKSAHTIGDGHGAYCFGDLGRKPEGENEISCYILLIFDLEGRTSQTLHCFVVPPADVLDGGFIEIRPPIDESKWAPYKCSLFELRKEVRKTIENAQIQKPIV